MPSEKPAPLPKELLERLLRETYPDLFNHPFQPSPVKAPASDYDRLPAHMREFLSTMSAEEVKKLEKLRDLKPSTIEWIAQKNDKELGHLDGAVEFVVSSRTSAKVLMWLMGIAFTIITSTWALAKLGIDVFNTFRGGIR